MRWALAGFFGFHVPVCARFDVLTWCSEIQNYSILLNFVKMFERESSWECLSVTFMVKLTFGVMVSGWNILKMLDQQPDL